MIGTYSCFTDFYSCDKLINGIGDAWLVTVRKLSMNDINYENTINWINNINNKIKELGGGGDDNDIIVLDRIILPLEKADRFEIQKVCSHRIFECLLPTSSFDKLVDDIDDNNNNNNNTTTTNNIRNKEESLLKFENLQKYCGDSYSIRNNNKKFDWDLYSDSKIFKSKNMMFRGDHVLKSTNHRKLYACMKQLFKNLALNNNNNQKKLNQSKSWHNYVEHGASPHDGGINQILDRICHVGRYTFNQSNTNDIIDTNNINNINNESNCIVSKIDIKASIILKGQIERMIGIVLGILRGIIPPYYLDYSFDINNIIHIPSIPSWFIILKECKFDKWEHKNKCVFDPRRNKLEFEYSKDYNELNKDKFEIQAMQKSETKEKLLLAEQKILKWEKDIYSHVSNNLQKLHVKGKEQWLIDFDNSCKESVVKFDAVLTLRNRQLTLNNNNNNDFDINDMTGVPKEYHRVLYLLRKASLSGLWPETTEARDKLIYKNNKNNQDDMDIDDGNTTSDSDEKENNNNQDKIVGGSFSIGVMGLNLAAPRGNALFPELVQACFDLEQTLSPHRIPSSTIAVNRNATFKPHRDTGAGAGQTISLIVALGNFEGGEIVVENEIHDIKYKPLEFNGFTERHWTLPFKGERFSLVWFRCLGVEDKDLYWLECNKTNE